MHAGETMHCTPCYKDPQHTLWSHDVVVADTTTADTTWVLARILEDILAVTRDQGLRILHADTIKRNLLALCSKMLLYIDLD